MEQAASFLKEWWGLLTTIGSLLTGGLLWSARLEWKIGQMETLEGKNPVVRKDQFQEFVTTERVSMNLKLDNLSSDISHLREIVELYHKEVTERLP